MYTVASHRLVRAGARTPLAWIHSEKHRQVNGMVRGICQETSFIGQKSEINQKESDSTPDMEPIIKSTLLPCSLPLFRGSHRPIMQCSGMGNPGGSCGLMNGWYSHDEVRWWSADPLDSTTESFLSIEYWNSFSLYERETKEGDQREQWAALLRSQAGSEVKVGCELYPEISSHTRNVGLLTSRTRQRPQAEHDPLTSHTGKGLNVHTVVLLKVKILRSLRDNLVPIGLIYKGRNWGLGSGG